MIDRPISYSATVSSVDASTIPQVLLPENPRRKGVIVHNATEGYAYVKYGEDAGPEPGQYSIPIPAGAIWTMDGPLHVGVLSVVCDDSLGALSVTEQL